VLVHDVLDFAASAAGTTDALIFGARRWSFRELADQVARLSTGLSDLVEPGDRVVVLSENCPQFVLALSAVPRAGGS